MPRSAARRNKPEKETERPEQADAKSPAGADICFIMDGETDNMIHSTVPPGQINRATGHETVWEFWYLLEGEGETWWRDERGERLTSLVPGVSIDIPVGTALQYRSTRTHPLKFICMTMPPWPGDDEANHLGGVRDPMV